mmetsp:Transcript_20093/g.33397  ORF Transcript_20093/g.33397 Transcript_20093/m.33397 type:complete len:367 (+) Transcript_20093:64-1164(+)
MNFGLSIESPEDEPHPHALGETKKRDSFMLSQSGTFKLQDFAVNRHGISDGSPPHRGSAGSPGSSSGPSPGSHAGNTHRIDVRSLDELEMGEDLGAGASGTVRRAIHRPTGEAVAVKQIQILEKAKRNQMVKELRIMRSHECPWLVSLYNAFYEEARVYMVLEFMDAGSIANLVDAHKDSGLRDERELAKLGLQVLNGLNYLHRQHHQVHRDLKPANVMLNKHGQVKISDFGISSQLDSTNAFCSTFVGTACYMAPERLSGGSYSYAADIWSFGLILLELALGSYPYAAADNYFKLLSSIMEGDPPTVPEADFTAEFSEFVSLCLDKSPNRRPSANDLLKHHWLRQHPAMEDLLLSGLMQSLALLN